MTAKHTPGPWDFEPARGFDEVKNHEFSERIFACDPGPENAFTIAFTYDVDELTRKTHARLIAAAPDLLQALERIISELPVKRDWLDPELERYSRDAIKKARGL